jgi:hypothetical protein
MRIAVGVLLRRWGRRQERLEGARTSDNYAKISTKMCECGDMHHFKFKCRTIADQTPVHKQSAEAGKGHEHTHAGIPSLKYSNSGFA